MGDKRMTKQEKIREGIEGMQFMPDEFEVFEGTQTWSIRPSGVKKILNKLHSQGVVIKVERELPCPQCEGSGLIEVGILRGGVFMGGNIDCLQCKGTGKVGHDATVPLIEK